MSRPPKRPGQVMVLGVVTMLILALSLMLSFNVTQAIHERIRLQQHSDAMAYSMATMEARALNYVAYTNRTMAAAYVSMTTAHAYMSAASLTVNILQAGQYSFYIIAALELVQSLCPYLCFCAQHCKDAAEAVKIAGEYGNQSREYGNKVKNHESDFNEAIKNLGELINTLHTNEQDAVKKAAEYAQGKNLDQLKSDNAPYASDLADGVASENKNSFACALEGAKDLNCSDPAASSESDRSVVMANVANAARPGFPRGRMPGAMILKSEFRNDKLDDIQGNEGTHQVLTTGGCGRVSASTSSCNGDGKSDQGKAIAARDQGGGWMAQWRDGFGPMFISDANIGSDDQSGTHSPGGAHQDQHGEFKPIQPEDVCSQEGNCFINFRATDDEKKDFGQPHVYGAFSQDLRIITRGKKWAGKNGPWELTKRGGITLGNGQRGDATLMLAPQREGHAISKALVYFHRYDDWKMAPNLFDAYWRAKLHPFNDKEEMKNALTKAGFPDDQALDQDSIVEGQR